MTRRKRRKFPSTTTENGGQMEVILGNMGNIDSKLSVLNDILTDQPQLREIRGTLELGDYSETNDRAGITFKKK